MWKGDSIKMHFKILVLLLFALTTGKIFSQWSTSTYTDSSLYVCPGFYSDILTFEDGSSIILGALQSYIFAQKLDPFGYKQWATPVQVLHNDSSFIGEEALPPFWTWGGHTSDGDGGVILFWYDYRGAYDDGVEFKNNSIYAQRIDKFGTLRWMSDGILVRGPASGKKAVAMANDGQGGCILAWSESGFGYPGAPNLEKLVAVRYDSDGQKLWETTFDSSAAQDSLGLYYLKRAGNYIYANIVRSGAYATLVYPFQSRPDSTILWEGSSGNYSWKDSVLFRLVPDVGIKLLKIGQQGDTIWSSLFSLPNGCAGLSNFRNTGIFPDNNGGLYYLYVCNDSIFHFDNTGNYQRKYFQGLGGGWVFSDGLDGVVISGDDQVAQRYDSNGNPLWSSSFKVLSDPGNAYFEHFASDNNGGIIISFWTTSGGIYVQHTGRNGRVGIITGVENSFDLPKVFELKQNFPNPFNAATTIVYSLSKRGKVSLVLYDIIGRKVMTLVDGVLEPNTYSINIDLSNVTSGVYIYELKSESYAQSKKMILMK